MEQKEQNQDQIVQLKQYLEDAQTNLDQAKKMLGSIDEQDLNQKIQARASTVSKEELTKDTKIIEGVFDGQNMVGPDGKIYTVAPNYVSKSKLVEGDILKLTIMPDGGFLYKQIGPVERKRLVGAIVQDEETREFKVLANGRSYKVILASVTYFKGDAGDQAVIMVPKAQDSKWAAIENIIKEGQEIPELEDGTDAELPAGDELELDSGLDIELEGPKED